jgi:methylated-DNA-protein-cysteine methyltransferase-like protein
MSKFQKKFDPAIWRVVSQINTGRVMSYGEVARAAGYPRHARMVSKALARSTEALPWHRVVRSNRTLAFDMASDAYKKQARLLKGEGVKIIKGNVIPIKSDADTSLDELLWGSQE